MLLVFIYIYIETGSFQMNILPFYHNDFRMECVLWLALFIPLAVKTPLFPFHLWLFRAHVEAPTIGSVLLAALVLKMSGFGFIRVLLPLCPRASIYFASLVTCICLIGGFYVAFTALSETDFKKIVAATSIIHMSYLTCSLFLNESTCVISAIYAMFAHGFVSAGLFFSIGCVYQRYGDRNFYSCSALWLKSPKLAFLFLFFGFANMAFPGTVGFPSEFSIFIAFFATNPYIALLWCLPLLLNGVINIWGLTRLCFGPDKSARMIERTDELNNLDMLAAYSCVAWTLLFGLYPSLITDGLLISFLYN
jgi:NADH-quinone oxidoreductase subunit M